MSEIKYEAVFGDQSLFEGAPSDAEGVFLSFVENASPMFYRLTPNHEYLVGGEWLRVGNVSSQTLSAMRRIIKTQDSSLDFAYYLMGIGSEARTKSVLKMNIENATRRSDCLSRIEQRYFMEEIDDDGEIYEECLLNWNESPDDYEKTFGDALSSLIAAKVAVPQWIPVSEPPTDNRDVLCRKASGAKVIDYYQNGRFQMSGDYVEWIELPADPEVK